MPTSNVRQLTDNGVPVYPITDRSLVIGLQDNAFATYVIAWDGASTPVPANIPAGVVVTYNETDYTGTLAASASTAQDLYLVASGSQQGEYDRYITTHVGSTYAWNALGSTAIVSPVIADDLVTNDSSKALSAKQGKILGDKTSELEAKVTENTKAVFGNYTDTPVTESGQGWVNINTGVLNKTTPYGYLYKIIKYDPKFVYIVKSATISGGAAAILNYYDDEDNYLGYEYAPAASTSYTNLPVQAPEGTDYIILVSEGVEGIMIYSKFVDAEAFATKESVEELEEKIDGKQKNIVSNAYLASNGNVASQSGWFYTEDYIPVNYGDTVVWNPGATWGAVCLLTYNSSKEKVGYYTANANERTITIGEANAAYLRASFAELNITNAKIVINGETVWTPIPEDIAGLEEKVDGTIAEVEQIKEDYYGVESPTIVKTATLTSGSNSMIITADEIGTEFVDNVTIEILDLSVSQIDTLNFAVTKNGTEQFLNLGYGNNPKVGDKYTLVNEEGARLSYGVYHGVAALPEPTVSITVRLVANIGKAGTKTKTEDIIDKPYFIPSSFIHRNGKDTYVYPRNLFAIDGDDYTLAVNAKNSRATQEFMQIIDSEPSIKFQIAHPDGSVTDVPDIPVSHFTPSAPTGDVFILPIGDSLMYGANMSYHGCINNELSRLFNGTGTAIANGDSPIGYNNVHIIGTMGTEPVKYEGRGGWSVQMYLENSAGNAFYNPNTQEFDLDYYLTQNGFYTEGVDADGSNLIIPIMLNWNSDPFENGYEYYYRKLVENIHASHANAKILLLGCNCPCKQVYYTASNYLEPAPIQAEMKRKVIEYERILADMAADYSYCYHAPMLPYYFPDDAFVTYNLSFVPRDPSRKLKCYADCVHPNLMGYGQLSDAIFNYLLYYFFQ